jgi:hypothetical protein
MGSKATTIDEYLAGVPPKQRATLQKLRETIHSIVPDAEECISYRMPAFRLDGRIVGGFAATASGCSYYPFSGSTRCRALRQHEGRAALSDREAVAESAGPEADPRAHRRGKMTMSNTRGHGGCGSQTRKE